MSPLTIVLIVLVIAAIWAVVELALTIRKARDSVDEITRNANQAIEQVQPIISKVDGMVDDLQPAIKDVQPIVEKADVAVDQANVSLARVNEILQDVHTVSNTASNVTTTVNKVADNAANGVAGVIDRITGHGSKRQPKLEGKHARKSETAAANPEAPVQAQAAGEPEEEPVNQGYVTYGAPAEDARDAE